MKTKKALHTVFLITLILVLAGCSRNIYRKEQKVYKQQLEAAIRILKNTTPPVLKDSAGNAIPSSFVPTVNFNLRKPQYVIIHHTAQNALAHTLRAFKDSATGVSAHYVIGKDGQVVQMLNDYLRAWHAGVARWGNDEDVNSASIGIELDNNSKESFSEAQMNSLIALLTVIKKNYNIPAAHFIGHSDVAPERKVDPGVLFDWKRLADHGFGLWYDADELSQVPTNFNPAAALKAIGYNTSDLGTAVKAFKLHFIPSDLTPVLTEHDKQILWNLSRKY